MTRTLAALLGTAIAVSTLTAAQAQELNLYSSRHYDTDERLYSDFTEATGITINRIEGNADELIARMQAEGANSPADVFLTVDTVRLARAASLGPAAVHRKRRAGARIPAYLQDRRQPVVRVLAARADHLLRQDDVENPPQTYQDLASPEYEGMVCIRSGTNVYTQNITAALIAHLGQDAVQDWATAVVGTSPAIRRAATPTSCAASLGRVRHRDVEHLLLRPRAAEGTTRCPKKIWRISAGSSPTRTTSARI
jgi:iron(III) transport system substrate-binding protein